MIERLGDIDLSIGGTSVNVATLCGGQPTLLVLLRHQDCPFCELHLGRLAAAHSKIGRIVAVSFDERAGEDHALPFTVVVARDERRRVYKALETRQMRLPLFALNPRKAWVLAWHLLRGKRLVRSGGSLAQLGADVIVDADGTVIWSHIAKDPSDRPDVDEIIAQMQLARHGSIAA